MKKKLTALLPWAAVACAFALSIAFFACYGGHNLDADMSSEMVLAKLQNEEGTLLSGNWLYSTELRLVSAVPLYQLGLLLFDSWHAARTFAVAALLALVVAAFLFMAKQAGLRKSAPWLSMLLCLPFNQNYAYISLYSSFYSMHVALSFVTLGLLCRYMRAGFERGKLTLLLLAALSAWGGLGGVRMVMMIHAPVFLAALILACLAVYRHETLREAAHEAPVRLFAGASVVMACSAAGYLVNMKVLAASFSFITYGDLNLAPFKLEEFIGQLDSIAMFFGYTANVPFFSDRGIASLVSLLVYAVTVIAVIRLFTRFGSLEVQQKFLLLTMLMAILVGMTLNVLLQQILVRYYLVGLLLLIVMTFLCWETEPCKNRVLRGGVLLIVMGMFAVTTQETLRHEYQLGEANYEMAADWLLERGYTQGYATFWNANTLTEASDGQIDMWVLADSKHGMMGGHWQQMIMQPILQRKSNLTQAPEGRVFLLVDEIEHEAGSPLFDKAHQVGDLVAWSYYIYEYESVDEMRALLAQDM